MKAVLLLATALSTFASDPLLSSFYEGMADASAGPYYCVSHPWECGETVGQLLQLLSPATRSAFTPPYIWGFSGLIDGFANGLAKTINDTSTCREDVRRINYELVQLYPYLVALLTGSTDPLSPGDIATMTCSSTALVAVDFWTDCDVQALFDHFLETSGEILWEQYQANMCLVNEAITGIVYWNNDYYVLGLNAGILFKVFFRWEI